MQRTRVHVLWKLFVILSFVCLAVWYFSPSLDPITLLRGDPEGLLPSGIRSYLRELRSLAKNSAQKPAKVPKKTRILCLILTEPGNLNTNAAVLNSTWVSRCHKHFFVLNKAGDAHSHDIINTPFVESRSNLVHKVRYAFNHLYTYHIDEFDWILKADDDTYVIMENLQFLLSHYDSSEPGYLGFHFAKMAEKNGYMSGGAGYVISNRAVRRLMEFGILKDACPILPNIEDPENSEDIEIGRCLEISRVHVFSSVDSLGKETFHPYPLQQYVISNHLPAYLYDRAVNFPKLGLDCCSEYSISFHYMSNEAMLVMDHLLYRTSVYGRNEQPSRDKNARVFKIGKVNIAEKVKQLQNRSVYGYFK